MTRTKKLSDKEIAMIHIFRGLGYGQREIADKIGISRDPVQRYLQEAKQEAEQSDEPIREMFNRLEPLLEVHVKVATND